MPSKVSHELNHESSPIDSNHLNDTEHPALHEAQVVPLSNEQTGGNQQVERFTIPATSSLPFPANEWRDLFSRRVINKQNGNERLPPDWIDIFAEALGIVFPYCCTNFKSIGNCLNAGIIA